MGRYSANKEKWFFIIWQVGEVKAMKCLHQQRDEPEGCACMSTTLGSAVKPAAEKHMHLMIARGKKTTVSSSPLVLLVSSRLWLSF